MLWSQVFFFIPWICIFLVVGRLYSCWCSWTTKFTVPVAERNLIVIVLSLWKQYSEVGPIILYHGVLKTSCVWYSSRRSWYCSHVTCNLQLIWNYETWVLVDPKVEIVTVLLLFILIYKKTNCSVQMEFVNFSELFLQTWQPGAWLFAACSCFDQ